LDESIIGQPFGDDLSVIDSVREAIAKLAEFQSDNPDKASSLMDISMLLQV